MKILLPLLVLMANTAVAQLPNAGFENWTSTGGYNNPNGWDNLNSTTAITGTFTTEKGTPGYTGNSYLKLTSKNVLGAGIVPGIAVSGQIDHSSGVPTKGFAYTIRSQSLTGYWQYVPAGADKGGVFIALTKWNTATNSRDTVASTLYSINSSITTWSAFSIDLNYRNTLTPDSAMIGFSSGQRPFVLGSYLYVDAIAFSGTVSSINTIQNTLNYSIYPNPTNPTSVTLNYTVKKSGTATIKITDCVGKLIKQQLVNASAGTNTTLLNIATLNAGTYITSIETVDGISTQRLVIE